MARRTERQLICGKRRCRNALRAGQSLGRYHISSDGFRASKTPDFIGSKVSLKRDRATLIRNAIQAEFFGGGKWREVVSPDGVRCYVTRLWGTDADNAGH